jgi:signal recognition particle GTPase
MGEMFLSTREKLLAYPNFRLKEYHAIMKDAVDKLNTIHGKMGAMMQKEAAEEAKRSYSILDALTPVERANESVNVINMAVKARITAATGASATEINVELRKFDEMKSFHKWLHRRVSKGLRLPMTQAEALEMMIDDRPELSEKNRIEQRKKQRRAQR